MGHAFYYIARCQNTKPEVKFLNISQKVSNQSLKLENTRSLWNRLTESEKLLKYKKNPWEMELSFNHSPRYQTPLPTPFQIDTPQYHSSSQNLVSGTEH